MTVRVYVPTTLDGLASLADDGVLAPTPDAVVAPDDDEETEYDAMTTAADTLSGPGRRIVVVAEVDDPDGPVRLAQVVAVHADDTDVAVPGEDLGWYAVSEIEVLLGRV